jgi:hypothetical protein
MLSPSLKSLILRKESGIHMATKVCFIKEPICGIGAGIAKAPLVNGNQVAATVRKPEAVKRASRSFVNLLPVAPDATCKNQVEIAVRLPSIAVVFTVGGPVIYERRHNQFA